ncbi:unnamed protein product [Orchesella dallaii]|uniref:C2H2-type domain-containing protein n=1 Tax=Orchesella dallaii TaxID=48710 RepID=A0ABP1Q7W2_9HEXA
MDSSSSFETSIASNSGPGVEEDKTEDGAEKRTVMADEICEAGQSQSIEVSRRPATGGDNGAKAEETESVGDASKKVDGEDEGDSSFSQNSVVLYHCQICNACLGSVELMKQHVNRTHPEMASRKMVFRCEKCEVLFSRLDLYHEHAKLHVEEKLVPVKDSRPKLKIVEPKSGPGRIRSIVGTSINVVRPRASNLTPVLFSTQVGTTIAVQCPEHHFELSSNNLSILVGTDGQPKLEWVLDLQPQ